MRSAAMLGVLAPTLALSQPAAEPVPIEHAYVAIVPTAATDVDDVLAVERGVELVLCQAGVQSRREGREAPAELKLAASLTKADDETDVQAREIVRRCEFTGVTASLPGGAMLALPDVAMIRRSALQPGRSAADAFFLGCGAAFTRGALDALKGKVKLRGSSCDGGPPSRAKPATNR